MNTQILLLLLFLASAAVATAAEMLTETDLYWADIEDAANMETRQACACPRGECIGDEGHREEEVATTTSRLMGPIEGKAMRLIIEPEIARRVLAQRGRYISYGALRRNNVPCRRRGQSYYNCAASGRANPYRRGCSAITHCARATG